MHSFAQPASAPKWVLLGTDKGPGISRCSWNPTTGNLGKPDLAVAAERPDFFALHPTLPRLYSVNSGAGAQATISSFHLDRATGSLTFAEKQSALGDGPCFVSLDATGRSLFAANYSGGSFSALPLGPDGALLPGTGALDCHKTPAACGPLGPNPDRQTASHPHCMTLVPTNDFVLGCDLGTDSLHTFAIQPGAANPLGPSERVAARPGSGPRHLAFHPNGGWLYVIHELDCTVELFDWAVLTGKSHLRRQNGTAVSTLAPGQEPDGDTGCEILVSPNGRFLTTCTRGAHSNILTVFSIAHTNGLLSQQQRISCGGTIPRHIAFDPTGRWLLCANQGSSTVTVFAQNPRTGKLSGPVQTIPADTPMFVQFV